MGGRAFATNQSSAISDSINLRHPEYFYGAVVSYPLGAVSERNQYRASKSVKKIAELQLKKAEQEIFLEIAVLINRAQSRLAQVELTRLEPVADFVRSHWHEDGLNTAPPSRETIAVTLEALFMRFRSRPRN